MKAAQLTYVLITPARNEEAHIEQTLKSSGLLPGDGDALSSLKRSGRSNG